MQWPAHFPPTDPVKKFFIGVRWLGPDLHFFRELRDQQAQRTNVLMVAWTTAAERELASLLGRHFRDLIGWRSNIFLPEDRFQVIAYGPRFQSMDNLLFEEALLGIEKDMGMKFEDAFWQQTVDWTFGQVVRAMLERQKEGAEPANAACRR